MFGQRNFGATRLHNFRGTFMAAHDGYEKGREAFQNSWNKYVSAGFVTPTESKPEVLKKYFGIGPSLAQRLLWE